MKFCVVLLLGLVLFHPSCRAQQYVLRMMNDGMPTPSTYEWDIYVQRTDGAVTGYAAGQYVFLYNSAIVNGGTLSLSIVPGSSELSNPVQVPQNTSITSTEMRVHAPPPPGYANGSWLAMSSPGTRICRVRLTNTVPFPSVSPNLTWKTSGSPPLTQINGYIANVNTVLVGNKDASGMSNPTMPVELRVFRAREEKGRIRLEWETEWEDNNAGFRILRGTDHGDGAIWWESVGYLQASGSVGPSHYSWIDHPLVASSRLVYRLEQIDLDGSTALGPVVSVDRDLPSRFSIGPIYPHPVRDKAWASVSSVGEVPVTIEIRNVAGSLLRRLELGTPPPGTSRYTLPVMGLPTGLYFLSSPGDDIVEMHPFSILR